MWLDNVTDQLEKMQQWSRAVQSILTVSCNMLGSDKTTPYA